MTALQVLRARGIVDPGAAITAATGARLELACACTLLIRESAGGLNVWGSDPVPTAGAYTKGSVVNERDYRAYRRALTAGRAGPQGVGPCQLTWTPYQDQADVQGGCWRPAVNMAVGFGVLAGLIKAHGVRGGFRRYNGSGPAAEVYADAAIATLERWREALGARAVRAPLARGDRGDQVRELQEFLRMTFPSYFRPLLNADGVYGPDTARWLAEFQRRAKVAGEDGNRVGPATLAALATFGY